jgi:hypothetical protein
MNSLFPLWQEALVQGSLQARRLTEWRAAAVTGQASQILEYINAPAALNSQV